MDQNDRKTPSPPLSREARLAAALRTNLRRRKALPADPTPPKPQDSD